MKRSRLGILCDRGRLSPVVGVALVALVAAACGSTQGAADGPSRAAGGANGAFSTFPGWDGNPANAIDWNYGSGQHPLIDCYKNTPTEKNKNVFSVAGGDALPLSGGQLDDKHISNRDVAWPAVMDLNIEPLRALRLATNTSGLRVPNTDPGSGDGTKAAPLGTGPFAAPGSTASPGNTCQKPFFAGTIEAGAALGVCFDTGGIPPFRHPSYMPIQLNDCNGGDYQRWVSRDGAIKNVGNENACLNQFQWDRRTVMAAVEICDGSGDQRFDLRPDGRIAGTDGRCMTYFFRGGRPGNIKMLPCSTSDPNQYFITDRTPQEAFASLRPSMRFRMELTKRGKCVDLDQGNTATGTPIKEEDCNGNDAQKWDLLTDGTIRTALDGGKCLDGGQSLGREFVWINDCNGGNFQKWHVDSSGTITNRERGLCMDSSAGTRLIDQWWLKLGVIGLYGCGGGEYQHIEFERVNGDSGQWEVTGPKQDGAGAPDWLKNEPGIALNGSAGWRNAGSDFALKGGCAERQDTVVACQVTQLASGDDRRVGLVGAYLWTLPIRLTIANDTSSLLVLRSAEAPAHPGGIGVPGTETRNAVAASDEVRIPASAQQGQPSRGSIGWLRKFDVPGAQAGLDYSSTSPASSSSPATLAAVKDDKPFKLIVTVRVINQNALEDLYDGHPIQDAVEDCVAGTRKPWVSEQQFSDNCYDQKLGIAAAGPSGGDPPKPDTPSDKLSYQNLEMTWNPPPMAAAARGARANTVPCQEGPELCFAPDPQYPVANMGAAAMSTGDNGFIDIAVTVKKGDGFRYYDLQTSRLE